jgi:membrane-associated phospholipid phosphatase
MRRPASSRALLFLVALGCVPAPAAAQRVATTAAARLPRERAGGSLSARFGADLRLGVAGTLHTVTSPLRWSRAEWAAVPATAIALATLSGIDQPVADAVDRHRNGTLGRVLADVEPLGAQANLALVAATYGVGLAFNQPALRRAGVEAVTSTIVASGIVTAGIKLLVGRSRPRRHEGPYAFHSLSGAASFPSGHTTQAFAVASVFAAEAHPLWAKALCYGLAGGVAAARMYHDAHYLSDVTAGAVIGTVTGRAIAHWDDARGAGRVEPYVGGSGIGLRLSF